MQLKRSILTALTVAVLILPQLASAKSPQALLRYVPESANMVVLLDVEQILQTPLARKRFWAAQVKMNASDRKMRVPPSAKHFVMAASFDALRTEPTWEVVLVDMADATVKVPHIAKYVGGNVDELAGRPAVWSPRDVYFVDMGKGIYGTHSPANRQVSTRWVKAASESNYTQISQYLQKAAQDINDTDVHMVVAIDLEGAFSPVEIRPELEDLKSIADTKIDRDWLTQSIASVKGISLVLKVRDDAQGILKVQFGDDVSKLDAVAKPLVMEVMAAAGTSLTEFKDWEASAAGNTITFSGPLTNSGLRRIFSLLDSTPELSATEAPATKNASGEELSDVARASLDHFQAVQAYVKDIRRIERMERYGDGAMWIHNYARKIDKLSMLNVDPELLDFSAYVAARFRECSTRLKNVGLRSAKRLTKHQNFYDTKDSGGNPTSKFYTQHGSSGYHRDGHHGYRSRYHDYGYDEHTRDEHVERYRRKYQDREKQKIVRVEKASGKQDVIAIMDELDQETLRMKRLLTERYKIAF